MSDEGNDVTPPGEPDDGAGPLPVGPDVVVDVPAGSIEPIEIQQEMEQSFLDYAMSVIVSRALPDVRDGLKPVHRRILWAMHEGGLRPDRNHRKCATVVGDVIGKYHPHGDSAVYDALVRMGQDFSLRHPLVDPHGNFGSPSDPPAAYRYTECRLTSLAMQMLADIDEEPTVLPSRFPNLLVNGSQGIAVGMATSIPPHNLGEVIDATVHLIEHPDATVDDLMGFVQGPDFPTGAQIMGRAGLVSAFRTGRGSIKLRARAEIEEGPRNERIVVTEVPYQTSVEQIEEKIAELVNSKVLDGIRELRNESARGRTRFIIELKRDAPGNVVLNNLFKHTPMQTSFPVNMVALVDGVPRTLTLRDAIVHYVEHQVEVIRRRSEFRLAKAQRRAHIVEGFLKALDLIDEIIVAIRASEDRAAAVVALQAEAFGFSEIQATEIVDMRLSTLTRLGRERLEEEMAQLRATIAELEAILGDEAVLRGVIVTELTEVREQFATERRSTLEIDEGDLEIEDLIDDEEVVVVMTARGYIKTVAADAFRAQTRGGVGVSGTKLKDEDFVTDLIHTSAHAYLLFFSNRGRVYRLKAHRIPMKERTAQGIALVNLLDLSPGEVVQTVIDTRDYETNRYLVFVTRNGTVKKTRFTAYDSSLRAGLIAIALRDDDELVRVIPTSGSSDVVIVSASGKGIRFAETDVREMGRATTGVRGMRLTPGDQVVGADTVAPGQMILTVTDGGFGKRTSVDALSRQGRGGQGMRVHRIRSERGRVLTGLLVEDDDHLLLVNDGGVIIRTSAAEISVQGRDATGVRVMNVGEDGRVAAVARVPASEDDADTDGGHGSPEVAPDGAVAPVPADEGLGTPDADSAGPGDETASE
jgi:DNA gyrase subunit A